MLITLIPDHTIAYYNAQGLYGIWATWPAQQPIFRRYRNQPIPDEQYAQPSLPVPP
jgi:hypothetical protein